ncbi:MAG TPA: hypothetical protein VFV80_08855 [Geminicoccaceae bacterium]|nr:hypothetical protein [Geminicoccaceae bacterium]
MPVTYALSAFDALPAEAIGAFQERLLRTQLAYCYEHSTFYRRKFDSLGLRPQDVRTLDDLRRLPILMSKEEERQSAVDSLEAEGHPFGMHLCARAEDLYLTATTSGTTGTPTFTYTFTRADMDVLSEAVSHRYRTVGARPGDRMFFCYALGIYATSLSLAGIRRAGILPIDVDVRAGSRTILEMLALTRPRWLACTPSLAEHLAARAPEILRKDVRELRLEGLFLTGETWATIPGLKQKLEGLYGCRAFDFWTPAGHACGISCDSDDYHGLHGIAPQLCTSFQDLVDPVSKTPVAIANGAIGEMVHTSLQRQACPAVKYAYGDVVRLLLEECPGCGFRGPRIKVLGRADDMLIVKGVNVYPTAIKAVVSTFVPSVTGDMRILLDVPPPRVEPPLRLKIEHGTAVATHDLPALAERIRSALHDKLRITPDIVFVPPDTFEKSTRKTPIFEKTYCGSGGVAGANKGGCGGRI